MRQHFTKQFTSLTIVFFGLLLLGAGCSYEMPRLSSLLNDTSPRGEIADGIEQYALEVKRGRTFTIELSGNEATGYRWTEQHTRPNIDFIKDEYIPNTRLVKPGTGTDDEPPEMIAGAGGTHFFTFNAIQHGYAQISFEYSRARDGGVPLKQVIYDISIK